MGKSGFGAMRGHVRAAGSVVSMLLVGGLLAGCAPTVGGPLAEQQTHVTCADIPDYSVPLLVAPLRNSTREPITVTGVMVGRTNNLVVSEIRVGDGSGLRAVDPNNGVFYEARFRDVSVKPVVIPAGATYDVLALASLPDDTADGTLSSFKVTYVAGKKTYVFDMLQAYRLSTQLTCQ